jgi:hypothetical protein
MSATTLMPFQPDVMTPAQLAAVSYLARYSGHTPTLCRDPGHRGDASHRRDCSKVFPKF